jgi:hypothetical protein
MSSRFWQSKNGELGGPIVNLDFVVAVDRHPINNNMRVIISASGVSVEIIGPDNERSFLIALGDRWAALDRIVEDAK